MMSPIEINYAQLNIQTLYPVFITTLGALAVLVIDLFKTPTKTFNAMSLFLFLETLSILK